MTILDRARLDAGVATVKSIVRGDDHTQVEINEILVARARDELGLARQRFENGDCSQLDVRAAEARLERAEGDFALSKGLARGDAGTYYAKLRKGKETKTVTLSPDQKYKNPSEQAEAENPGWKVTEAGKRSDAAGPEGAEDYGAPPPGTYDRGSVVKAIEAAGEAADRAQRRGDDDAESYLIYKGDRVIGSRKTFREAVAEAKKQGAEYVESKGGKYDGEVAWQKRNDHEGDRKPMPGGGEASHGEADHR